MEKVIKNKLKISKVLYEFLENDVLSPLNVNSDLFWKGFEEIIYKFSPLNKKLLEKRDEIKNLIDDFYKNNKDKAINQEEYISFLKDIGYIVPEGPDFKIETENVDEEIAKIAGPQLVVPVTNARYSLNAANARWGSLYDALYGTDLIPEEDQTSKGNNYNPKRGEKVIEFGRNFLDEHFPLTNGSHHEANSYEIENKKLIINFQNEKTTLKETQKFVGFSEKSKDTRSILLKNNNLHVEIVIDPNQLVGKSDKAGINDIILESAITTIQDCEDSVAAVDAEDKVLAYKNWLGLMNGSLNQLFKKVIKLLVES